MMHKNIDITFYLIRHVQCEKNKYPDIIGGLSFDSPVSELGERQIIKLKKRLADFLFDEIYVSPAVRTLETARAVEGRLILKEPALLEQSQGDWQGKSREEVYNHENKSYINTKGYHFIPPAGESQRMVERRISNWIEDKFLYNPQYLDKKYFIVLFTHGMLIKCFLHYVLGFSDRLIYIIELDNASITSVTFNSEGWHVNYINRI